MVDRRTRSGQMGLRPLDDGPPGGRKASAHQEHADVDPHQVLL
ncbi:MAG: hypothetical protein ABEL97_13300 [Salinibacter sp.]